VPRTNALQRQYSRDPYLEDWCPPIPGFFLYYSSRRKLSPALAAFIDAVRVPAKARKGRRSSIAPVDKPRLNDH
jgi:DNA-binding transcriptional LysR family regulator